MRTNKRREENRGRDNEIGRLYRAGGTTYKKLGEEFGVSSNRIRQIVIREEKDMWKATPNQFMDTPSSLFITPTPDWVKREPE